jgi:predicted transcriptional regulator
MFGWLFKREEKRDFEQHKGAVQTALNNAKQDILNISKWVKHLDEQDSDIKNDVENIMDELTSIKNELGEIKEMMRQETPVEVVPMFKQRQTAVVKQTPVYDVQTAVQTTVQAAFFTKLSVSEKAIIGILVNTDMKLSYEDLAAMMGKDTATVRGQVNSIKQKCEGLIEEQIEKNGKKRLFVPENMKDLLLKKVKTGKKKRKEIYTE